MVPGSLLSKLVSLSVGYQLFLSQGLRELLKIELLAMSVSLLIMPWAKIAFITNAQSVLAKPEKFKNRSEFYRYVSN